MAVELRSVHTGKLHFVSHQHTAGSAHTGPVHHDGIHADNRGNAQLLRGHAGEFHHDHGTDGHAQIIVMAFADQLLQHGCTDAVKAVAAVVRTQVQIAHFAHLFFQNQKVFRPRAYDDIALDSMIMQPFCLRIDRSRTHAACNEDDLFLLHFFKIIRHQLGRASKRPYKICNFISCLQSHQLVGGHADGLERQCDGPCFPVIIADCQRDTFCSLVDSYNNELSRLAGPGYARCINNLLVDCCRELLCFQNLKHTLPPNYCSNFTQQLQFILSYHNA